MAQILNTIVDPDDILTSLNTSQEGSGIYETDELYINCVNKVFGFKAAGNFAAFTQADASLAGGNAIITCAPTYIDSSGATVAYADGELAGSRVTITNSTSDDGTYLITDNTASSVTVDYNASTFTADGTITIEIDGGSGATGQCLYSAFKKLWQTTPSITKFDFPMLSITNEQFEFIDDWKPTLIAPIRGVSNEIAATTKADNTHTGGQNVAPYSETTDIYTRRMIRTAGWSEVESDGGMTRRYFNLISLGTLNVTDQPYYVQDASLVATTTDTQYTGPMNEPVQFEGDSTKDSDSPAGFDTANDTYFKVFVRTRGFTYSDADLNTIGVSQLTYIAYRFPVSNASDININTTADTDISSGTTIPASVTSPPYNDINVTYLAGNIIGVVSDTTYSVDDVVQEDNGAGSRWFIATGAGTVTGSSGVAQGSWGGTATWTAYTGEREVETNTYSAYNVIIDADVANNGTPASRFEIYEWAQWALRAVTGNINADNDDDRRASIADSLVTFVGDNLNTLAGVFIDDNSAADENLITFIDVFGVPHVYPTVVPIAINFNANLSDNTGATNNSKFYCYYKYSDGTNGYTNLSNDFGTPGAVEVDSSSEGGKVGSSVTNNVPTSTTGSTFNTSFAYSSEDVGGDRNTGGGTGTPTDFVTVAIGLSRAQYIAATETITNTGATVSLVSALERNYSDPV